MEIYWDTKTRILHLTIETKDKKIFDIMSNIKETLGNIKIKELSNKNLLCFPIVEITSSLDENNKTIVNIILDTNIENECDELIMV